MKQLRPHLEPITTLTVKLCCRVGRGEGGGRRVTVCQTNLRQCKIEIGTQSVGYFDSTKMLKGKDGLGR